MSLSKTALEKKRAKQRGKKARRRWREIIYQRDGFRCAYCAQVFPSDQLSVDHFWPAFMGGVDAAENFLTACLSCGKLKAHLPPLFFRKHRAELAQAVADESKLFFALQREKVAQ